MKSFAEMHPELVNEWSNENALKPQMVSYGSGKAIIWNGKCGHTWTATPKNRGNGHGCPYCSGNKVLVGFNDLKSQYPRIAREWARRNLPDKPTQYTTCSHKRFWWRCHKCGHEWEAPISDRTRGHGCPCCTHEIIKSGINDLNTLFPDIAAEWSYKNHTGPTIISPKSTQNVWWVCSRCGNEWQGVVRARVKGRSCPVCTGFVLKKGFNDLASVHPKLLKEWDYDRNVVSPDEVLAGTMQSNHERIYIH